MSLVKRRRLVRGAGLAGVVASVAYGVGDVLMLGKPVRPDEHPVARDLGADNSALAMIAASTTRLTAGSSAGVYATPLYLAAIWHLYQGLLPAGRARALPPALILSGSWTWASFIHGSFFHFGESWKSLEQLADDPKAREILHRQTKAFERSTLLAYAPLITAELVASALIIRAVASGKTAYPRWSGPLLAPVLPIVAAMGLTATHILPGPARHALQGAGLSLGHLVNFGLSTALLWRNRKVGTD